MPTAARTKARWFVAGDLDGFFGLFFSGFPDLLLIAGLALLVAGTTFTVACGSNSNHQTPTNNQVTLMVTGTSGAISHTVPVMVTVR